MRSLNDFFFHHDLSGFTRAGAIVAGLTVTSAGYLVGSISLRITKNKEDVVAASFQNATASPKSH